MALSTLFLCAFGCHIIFYALWRSLVAGASEKTRAWGLTLEISSLYSLLGFYWVWEFCAALARGTALHLLAQQTPFDELCIVWMISYLVVDLFFGLLDYRSQLRVDTTYVHHALYFLVEVFCLLNGYARYYLIFSVLELPTCVLALGSAFPSWRHDALFGGTFLITRILYEVFVAAALVAVGAPMPLYLLAPPVVASLAMHVVWMRAWMAPKKGKGKGKDE